MNIDEKYMWRCIQLAKNGKMSVSPNPMVGAVIVYNGKIIGEGYHQCCGQAHAEVNAVNSVKDKSLLPHSTIYVSLEPCSHYGKTPPCVELIIRENIPNIVIGCRDPFIKVAGRGIKKLQDAGRNVTVGVLEKECMELISHFSTHHTLHRPYVILKWAESSDGFIDRERIDGSPVRLSTDLTGMIVHKRRAEADAIMVGTNTALLDNPSLTVRNWYGKNPLRVILDKYLMLSTSLNLFDDKVPTLVYTLKQRENTPHTEYVTLNHDQYLLPQIMSDLAERNIQTLLVEGGSKLLQSFINDGIWDEIYVEKSSKILNSGVKSPEIINKNSYCVDLYFGVPIEHYFSKKA